LIRIYTINSGGQGEHRKGGIRSEHSEGGDWGEYGIERGGLPWQSARLPYLAGSSAHGRIERWCGVDPQEAARRSSIRRPGEEGEEEVVAGGAGGEETVGTSPAGIGSTTAEGGGCRSGVRAAGWIKEESGWDGGEERDT
jgi:hypothetical protein